jgi:acetyl esterase/lipase
MISRVEEFSVPSFDGLPIQGFLFSTNTAGVGPRPGAVIYIPPRTYQMRRKYDLQPELIANSGFDIVGVNYRGMDGFGSDFSRLYDAEEAARDVLFVTRQLIREGKIGAKPLYLLSQSLGSEVMKEVLMQDRELWSGAIFQGSVIRGGFEDFNPKGFPPLFLTIGENDPAYEFTRRFERWAADQDVSVKTFYVGNYAHYNADLAKAFQQEISIVEFLIGCRAAELKAR